MRPLIARLLALFRRRQLDDELADEIGGTLQTAEVYRDRQGFPLLESPRGRVQVIGVTEDVVNGNVFDEVDASSVYFPTYVQPLTDMSLLVRARSDDVEALRSAVTTAVKEVAPEMPFQVLPMRTLVGLALWIFQAFSMAASLLGVVGLLFAYSGTHAVVSFLAAQRRREFGVRMALGASAWQIVWGMLIETLRTASIGVVAGLAVAAGLIRLVSSSKAILPAFGARPFVVGAAIVVVATAVAALAPLRGAARIDPAQALRTE